MIVFASLLMVIALANIVGITVKLDKLYSFELADAFYDLFGNILLVIFLVLYFRSVV